ncbi:MAG: family 78 glycoside hydrolase catalytic domain [Clostridia bacterium]|nr:family 78 glycoside hydrolase catalytic domain [Clostridia bacterium]
MRQSEIFGKAKWISHRNALRSRVLLRSRFNCKGVKKALIRVMGLGVFHCYINGTRVSDELFMPLSTDFESRENFPRDEVLSHRIYVPEYDITSLLKDGENELTIHFGGGWYTYEAYNIRPQYGDAKAIWRIFGETENGVLDVVSSTEDEVALSYVTDYYLTTHEVQDYTVTTVWEKAVEVDAPDTDYLTSSCPPDRVCEVIVPEKLLEAEEYTLYDIGKNTSALPVVKALGKRGERIRLRFFEELDGELPDERYNHSQRFEIVCDGEEREATPLFTWFAFRYFTVEGNGLPVRVEVVHSDVDRVSSLDSDNEVINWLNETYINTQLCNMHSGIPSDCPHLERRGYTGDGQLVCHTAMTLLDTMEFYKKWIYDIYDCQDRVSGHVQYTAPYTNSGGGPGGWGCAIIEVPYQYWKHYGDTSVLFDGYDGMLHYFDYLEAHSEMGLVVSDKEGAWCLGEWCAQEHIILPAPFVNNYFYVKCLDRMCEIARVVGRESDIPLFEKRRLERTNALVKAYFNPWDGNFLGCRQGANAFAVDIGIGDERAFDNMVSYYKALGRFDTGIFATDIVSRLLFERGEGQLALDLITASANSSFDGMRRAGATTLWEYWPESFDDRSHNHPMFGAVVSCFYDYLLGIQQKKGSVGYTELVISPVFVDGISRLSGEAHGTKVSYVKDGDVVKATVTVPEKASAFFRYGDMDISLSSGKNCIELKLK